jgi:S-formylglutathione hydrolase FrmB
MKKILFLFVFIQITFFGQGQSSNGKIIIEKINSPALQNTGGENPVRSVSIYLPPGYDQTTNRYPIIYYLPGFAQTDSSTIASDHLDQLLDKAIVTRKIRPVIVVVPNENTLYRGSYNTNSSLTGNWIDFTAKELVTYVDQHYRTIPNGDSRGITGYSMGGGGAIKLGMFFPDIFSVVYGISPGPLVLVGELGANGEGFRRVQQIKTREELINTKSLTDFLTNALVAMGRAFSPNPSKPPFYCDLPFTYQGDSLITDYRVLELWNKNMPFEMVENYSDNLKKLRAVKFDWGRNDEVALVRLGSQMFSQKLEAIGINHYAEEYIGTHFNKIYTEDGRALNDMLPFFNTYLKFEEIKSKTAQDAKKQKISSKHLP